MDQSKGIITFIRILDTWQKNREGVEERKLHEGGQQRGWSRRNTQTLRSRFRSTKHIAAHPAIINFSILWVSMEEHSFVPIEGFPSDSCRNAPKVGLLGLHKSSSKILIQLSSTLFRTGWSYLAKMGFVRWWGWGGFLANCPGPNLWGANCLGPNCPGPNLLRTAFDP